MCEATETPSRWEAGDQIVYREVWQGKTWTARPMRVVQDIPELVALSLGNGTQWKYPAPLDGRSALPECLLTGAWRLVDKTWTWGHTLLLIRLGEPHAVHVMWRRGSREFVGWYINLQECLRRTHLGFDTMDQELDIVVRPDLSEWVWKDEALFERAQEAGRFSPAQAREIRAEGERVLELVRQRKPPFGDGWECWSPPPEWPIPVLPQDWDVVPAPATHVHSSRPAREGTATR